MIEIYKLKKISTYAQLCNKSTTYIRLLVERKKIELVVIDGVHFVDVVLYPPELWNT